MPEEQASDLKQSLDARREEVKKHIEDVLKSPNDNIYNATDPDINSINDIDSLVKYLNEKHDFLSYQYDFSQGINLYKDGDSLVRDERTKRGNNTHNAHSDAIYLCNLIRASVIFYQHKNTNTPNIKEIKKTLEEINNLTLIKEQNNPEKEFLKIHNKIKNNYLHGKTDKDITLALAYVELQNTHYNVSTITNDGVISSLKLKGFDDELKNKLQQLAANTNLSYFSDFIAKKSAEIISSSKEVKVIHASLSKIIPALTDAYEDTDYKVNNNILEEASKTHRTIDQSLPITRSYFSPHRITKPLKSKLNKKTINAILKKAKKEVEESNNRFNEPSTEELNKLNNGQLQLSLKDSLDARREEVKNHINTLLKGNNAQIHNPQIPDIKSATDPESINQYLNQMVDYYATQYDRMQGIQRYIDGDSLIRDARNQTANNRYAENNIISTEADKYAEKIQFYNAIRAAIAFMEYHGHTYEAEGIKTLSEMASSEEATIEKLNATIVSFVNVTAGKNLKIPAGEEPIKHITESIGKLIHYTGLMDKHYNVSTLIKTSDNKEFVVSSLKLKGFNNEIKKKLKALSDKTEINTLEDFIAKKSAEIILNNNNELKVIPTQFSKLVPGLRNAYEESTYEVTNNQIGEESLLFTGYRSGSPAFLGDNREQNTRDAINTFQEQVGANKVLLNSLMTAISTAPDEDAAHKLIDTVTSNEHILKAYTPVNIVKELQTEDIKAFQEILEMAEKKINHQNLKASEPSQNTGSSSYESIAPIRQFFDYIKRRWLKDSLTKDQKRINALKSMKPKSYEFAAAMRQLVHDIKSGYLKDLFTEEEKNNIADLLSFCKSGKDRTGILCALNTDNAIGSGNEEVTVNSGHQQILTGMNGGTPGAYGTKGTIFLIGLPIMDPSQMPDQYKHLALSRDTSMGNIFNPDKSTAKDLKELNKRSGNYYSSQNKPATVDNNLNKTISDEEHDRAQYGGRTFIQKVQTTNNQLTTDISALQTSSPTHDKENPTIQKREEKVRGALHSFFGNDGTVEKLTIQNNDHASLDDLIKDSLIAYDESQGITRYIKDDCLIRDARQQIIPQDNSHEIHALQAQCYNFCRAAKLVLEFNRATDTEVDNNIITDIPYIADTKQGADNVKRKIIWFIAEQLGKEINKKTYNEISAQMNVAIHCATLDDQSYNISTIMKIPSEQGNAEKTIIQSDVKVKGFNEELLSIFQNILSFNDEELKVPRYKWYNNLDNFNKFIARKACQKIVAAHDAGNIPVIPNQLSDIIPGLKNAYSESTYVKDDNNDIKIITQSYRSSLPKIVAAEALKSFYSDIGTKKIYLNSLIDNNEEEHLSNISEIRTQDFILIKSSDNFLPFDTVLKKIAGDPLKEIITLEANEFIEKGGTPPLKNIFVKNDVNDDVKKAIETLVECRKLMNKKARLPFDGSLYNNELANKIQMVMHDIQHGALRNYLPESLKNRAILSFCESGSNRTGAVFQGLIDQALMRSIGKDRESEIRNVTIKGGQQCFIADGSGGTTGALGIKNTGDLKELVNDISTYGSPKYSSPSKTKKHKKDKKQMNNTENQTITNSASSETSEKPINTHENNKSTFSYIYNMLSAPVKAVFTGFGIDTEKVNDNQQLNINELNSGILPNSLIIKKEEEDKLKQELEELESNSNRYSINSFETASQGNESSVNSDDFLSVDDNPPKASAVVTHHDIEGDNISINSNSSENKNLEDESNMKQDLLRQSSNGIQVNTKSRTINYYKSSEEEKESDTSEEKIYGLTSAFLKGRQTHNTNSDDESSIHDPNEIRPDVEDSLYENIRKFKNGEIPAYRSDTDSSSGETETYKSNFNLFFNLHSYFYQDQNDNTEQDHYLLPLTQPNLNGHNSISSESSTSNHESSNSQTSENQDNSIPLLNTNINSNKNPTIYSYLSTALTRVSALPALALRGFRSNVHNTKTISPIVGDNTEVESSELDYIDISDYKDTLEQTINPLITDISPIQTGLPTHLGSDSSDSSSTVSTHKSKTPSSGYNIFNFNFNNLLPKYENPLNIFKNLNIFKPKSNINSPEAFTIPENELKDDMGALVYQDTVDKKSYLSSIYNAFAFPFNKLASTALSKKHVDNELTASQPQTQTKEEVIIQPVSTSIPPETADPKTKKNYESVMKELKLKNKFVNNPVQANVPPVVSRKEKLNSVIKSFLDDGIPPHNPPYPEEKTLKDLIDYHTTQYDAEQGILRYIEDDNLIRDARKQKIPEDNSHEEHAWKAQCYNFCRAAELVLSYHKIQPQVLMTKVEEVDIVINKESADNFKRSLVWFIADETDQDHTKGVYNKIAKQLDTAINCSVIDDTSYNVATVMYINNTTVIQSDVKVKGFNEELLEVFQTIATYNDNNNDKLDGPLYEWYHKHNDFNKFIAREACKKIVEAYNENLGYFPVIPNQLRAIIPGLKNAYLESVDVMDGDNIKTIMQSYRSTLPAYKQDIPLTTDALKSFKEDTGTKNIYLTSLVTGNEQKGPSTLTKILNKDTSLKLIQSPLNLVRNFGTRDFNPFDTVLKEIADSLHEIITPEAKAFIETERKSPGQSLILKKIKPNLVRNDVTVNDDMKKAIETLVECRELMNRKVRWRFYGSLDNHNLANKIQMVMYDIQHGALKAYLPKILENTEILTFCKSGKDRTGSDFQNLIDQVLMRLLGKTYEAVIMDATIKAGQQAYLAGAGGGTTAAFGIKNDGGLHARKEYVKAMPTALATYGNRTPKYKKEIDSFENIALGEQEENPSNLTEENLKSRSQDFNQESDYYEMSSLTDDNEYTEKQTSIISRLISLLFNPFSKKDAQMHPERNSSNDKTKSSASTEIPRNLITGIQANQIQTRKKNVLNASGSINGSISSSTIINEYPRSSIIRGREQFNLYTNEEFKDDNSTVSELINPTFDNNSNYESLKSSGTSPQARRVSNYNWDNEDESSTAFNPTIPEKTDKSIQVGDGQLNQTPQQNNINSNTQSTPETPRDPNTTPPYIPIHNPTTPQNQTLQNNLTPTIVAINQLQNQTQQNNINRGLPQNNLTPTITRIPGQQTENGTNNNTTPYIPIHPEISIHNPTTPEHQQPQYQPQENQTQQNTIPPIHQPQNQQSPYQQQYQQPTYQQQNQPPQYNRPTSPRSITRSIEDYDDNYYDDFDRYPPMPYYNTPPAPQSPGLTTNQIVMSVMLCLALTVLFGGLGLIFGIGISAAIIEVSKPSVSVPTPPPIHDYRGKGRGRGRERERDIEYTQMPQQEQQPIQTHQNNAPAKPSIASKFSSGVYNMLKKPFSSKKDEFTSHTNNLEKKRDKENNQGLSV